MIRILRELPEWAKEFLGDEDPQKIMNELFKEGVADDPAFLPSNYEEQLWCNMVYMVHGFLMSFADSEVITVKGKAFVGIDLETFTPGLVCILDVICKLANLRDPSPV